jgi:hypothetical protein
MPRAGEVPIGHRRDGTEVTKLLAVSCQLSAVSYQISNQGLRSLESSWYLEWEEEIRELKAEG